MSGAGTGAPAAGGRHPSVGRWLPPLVAALVVAGAWQVVAVRDPYLLPPLPAVAAALLEDPRGYAIAAGTTAGEALAGLVVGVTAGLLTAVVVSEAPAVRRAVLPLAVVANVTPVVAIAPALVVALGFGPAPKIVVTALITFFPVLVGTAAGLRSAPADTLAVLASVRASRWEVLWWLRLPASLPYVTAALRVVFPLSLVGAVVAELVAAGSARGLGTVISIASSNAALPQVYAAVVCLALLGLALLGAAVALERRVLVWQGSRLPSRPRR